VLFHDTTFGKQWSFKIHAWKKMREHHDFLCLLKTHFAPLRALFSRTALLLQREYSQGAKAIDEVVAMRFSLRVPWNSEFPYRLTEEQRTSCRYTNTTKTRNSALMFPPTAPEYARAITTHPPLSSTANGVAKKPLDGIA